MGRGALMIQSRFRSRSEHTLDEKGRLNLPSRFREVLRQYESEMLMIAPWGRQHLRVYPLSVWELLENKLLGDGREQKDIDKVVRYMVGGVNESTLDKQGRILLPQSLRQDAGLKKDVVLIGMLDWIEIWDKESWIRENESTGEGFDGYRDSLSRLGIF